MPHMIDLSPFQIWANIFAELYIIQRRIVQSCLSDLVQSFRTCHVMHYIHSRPCLKGQGRSVKMLSNRQIIALF